MTEPYKSLESQIREVKLQQAYEFTEARLLDEAIMNSNSSGQGYDPNHKDNPYHNVMVGHGYHYSHTTPIRQRDGSYEHHHTYKSAKNSDYNASVYKGGWITGIGGLARKTRGMGTETLAHHLKNRRVKDAANGDPTKNHHVAPKHGFNEALNEDQQIDEISKEKLGKYVKGATQDIDQLSGELTRRQIRHSMGDTNASKGAIALAVKHLNRKAGVEKAVNKLVYEPMRKEETESVNELKKTTLGSYIQQAAKVLPAKERELDDVYKHDLQKTIDAKNPKTKAKVMKDIDNRERTISNHHKGIERAVSRLTREEVEIAMNKLDHKNEEVEPVEELLKPQTSQNPIQQKLAAEKQQVQKQKGEIQLQIAKEKAAKQEQAMKQKGQQQLSKIKEEELDERILNNPIQNHFGRAQRFSRLHAQAYQRLASQGELGRAELHRKRMIEWKRRAYLANDNPNHLQR